MATDKCCGNQQLDTDEEKEEASFELSSPLCKRESVRGE
jgi:hypothetical protein